MKNGRSPSFSSAQIALALRVFLETEGNQTAAAKAVGTSQQTVKRWAVQGEWDKLLDAQRRELEEMQAAEALRQLATIRELRVNIHYRSLSYIHQRILEWELEPILERGPFPFDPLRLADAMAKADQGTGSGQAQEAPKVEDALATA